jgi:2,4-dienoyl-CoA reductase (NADPH2)
VFLLERFEKHGVKTHTSVKVEKINDRGVEVFGENWGRHFYVADTVVIAVGSRSRDSLYSNLTEKVDELYAIGDCTEPSRILEAVHDATYIANRI